MIHRSLDGVKKIFSASVQVKSRPVCVLSADGGDVLWGMVWNNLSKVD
jgi:hypothetical protein